MNKRIKAIVKGMALSMVAIAAIACAQVGARADVFVASNGFAADPGETNSTGSPTIAIAPNPLWAPALPGSSWVSYGVTGDPSAPGYFEPPNGTVVTFNQTFVIPVGEQGSAGGSFTVRADDTTSVFLNGNQLATAAPGPVFLPVCSPTPIGCLVTTQRTFTFAEYGGFLNNNGGLNTLSFGVVQAGGFSFGLNYAGTITTQAIPPGIPEPATMLLLGTGLAGLAGAVRRRTKASRD